MSAPEAPPASVSGRLIGTLAGTGALAGFLLVFAFQATQPTIAAHKETMLKRAVLEVLKEPARFEALEMNGERVYAGYDAAGKCVGYAIVAGFQTPRSAAPSPS